MSGEEEQPVDQLTIRFLGGFQLSWGQEPLAEVQTPLFRRLLAFLIVHRQTVHSRQRVAFLLWPDVPETKARRNLRQLLYRLRRQFPEVERFVEVGRKTVRWCADAPFVLDVSRFTEAAARAEAAADDDPAAIPLLEEAVSRYRGELLPGLYDEWVLTRRERLHQKYLALLHRLAEALATQGAYRRAIAHARRLLEAERLRESTYHLLLRLHISRRDRAGAIRVYREAETMLAEAFGVEPGAGLRALQRQAQTLPQETVSPTTPANSLPAQPTPFVGREEEVAQIGARLRRPDCRLLTLSGLGGSGKTRLALEAAGRVSADFSDGVAFVPLSGARSRQDLVGAIATALDFSFEGRLSPLEQLLAHLRQRRLLLLLDSFERVWEEAPVVAKILEEAPEVVLLVTSRRVLNLRWEWRFPVSGLAVPPTEGEELPEAVADYDAVTLFLQIARRIDPDFALTGENAPAVAHICRVVEGLPLALELAAVWMQEHSCAEIAEQISRNLGFPERPLRDMPPRQRTLQATFAYSWQSLPARRQEALACLSVFPAPFTAAAAAAVAGAEEATLEALVAHSLLRKGVGGRGNAVRYDLHDLLQEYAAGRLADSGGETEGRDRHAAYYLHRLSRREDDLRGGPGQPGALAATTAELEHVVAAWRHAVAARMETLLQPATFPLYLYLSLGNRYEQGRELFCAALQLPATSPQYAHNRAYAARFLYHAGDYPRAGSAAAEALARGRAGDDLDAVAASLYVLASVAYTRGAYRQAIRLAEEGVTAQRSRGDRLGEALCYNLLGLSHLGLFGHSPTGDPLPAAPLRSTKPVEAAQRYYRRALALHRACGYEEGEATALHNLGHSHIPLLNATVDADARQPLLTRMIGYLEEAAALHRRHDQHGALAQTLNWLGFAHARWRERAAATAYYREALASIAEVARPKLLTDVLSAIAVHLWLPSGRPAEAVTLLALALAHPATDARVQRRCRQWLAQAEAQLPADAYAAAAERGRQMAPAAAVRETLGALADFESEEPALVPA